MNQIIAMHGWGGDSQYWRLWAEYFQNNGWHWQSGDRGYGEMPFLEPSWPKETHHNSFEKRVVIGHSLGPHLLKKRIIAKATHVIFLNSFSRFIPEGRANRSIKVGLQGMQKTLGTAKEQRMLLTFLEKSTMPHPLNTLPEGPITKGISLKGHQKLESDLKILIKTEKLPDGLPAHATVLIVDGAEDAIVAPSAKEVLRHDLQKFLHKQPTHWIIPKEGHSLLQPGLKERIHNWLNQSPWKATGTNL